MDNSYFNRDESLQFVTEKKNWNGVTFAFIFVSNMLSTNFKTRINCVITLITFWARVIHLPFEVTMVKAKRRNTIQKQENKLVSGGKKI